MIKDITIGQFFPGNSVIHKLDPRIKLVLTFVYIVIVFLCKNFVSLASIVVALTVVILLSKISPKLIWKSVKPIFIIIAITSLLQIFYNKDGTVLFTIGKFSLYTGGLYMAIFYYGTNYMSCYSKLYAYLHYVSYYAYRRYGTSVFAAKGY